MRDENIGMDVADGGSYADDDAGENDERHSVADSAVGELLAEPHNRHGSGGHGKHGEHHKSGPGLTTMPPSMASRPWAMPNDWTKESAKVR